MSDMKRTSVWLLALALVVGLLTGCSTAPAEQTTSETRAETVPSTGQTVKTVDELLAAIAPGAEIYLEAGTYNLSAAADYGKDTDSEYYEWISVGDGYALRLVGVDDLTIRGSGMDNTTLAAEPRYANVMTLLNCNNVTLEDFTAGHTVSAAECTGGVLALQGCRDITMNRIGLYGCGVNGVAAQYCSNISIGDSRIYDCSSSAVTANESSGVTVERCEVYNIGDRNYGGFAVFSVNQSSGVSISDNRIFDNSTYSLVVAGDGSPVEMRGNQITGNRVRESAFNLYNAELVLDENTFENNTIRNWYQDGASSAVDKEGKALTQEDLDSMNVRTEEEPGDRDVVHVATVDEFLEAIAPNTEIILDEALYDFSTAAGYGETAGEYYYWEETFDGPQLVISDVNNLVIRSEDGDVKAHTLTAVPRYANVLNFNRCSNISLSGFTAGHTVEPGSCAGGVLKFTDSDYIQVDNCGLYGCGVLGVQTDFCGNIQVSNCDIYECSQGGIYMYGTQDIVIEKCTFRDLGGDSMTFMECENVKVDEKAVDGNTSIS